MEALTDLTLRDKLTKKNSGVTVNVVTDSDALGGVTGTSGDGHHNAYILSFSIIVFFI